MLTKDKYEMDAEEGINSFGLQRYWRGCLGTSKALASVLIFTSKAIKQATGDALSTDFK